MLRTCVILIILLPVCRKKMVGLMKNHFIIMLIGTTLRVVLHWIFNNYKGCFDGGIKTSEDEQI